MHTIYGTDWASCMIQVIMLVYLFLGHTVGPQPCASSPHSLNQGKI